MKKYRVLPHRYRPQSFSEVVGQEAVVQTLKNAIQHNRLAPAYLFSGSRGTGKTTLARLLAKAINCESLENGDPCNRCSSCLEINQGKSLDIVEIDGASNRGIDDIRKMNENVGYAPSSGKYKIYIIDEVHMLTKEAFNALLKTLEEPPSSVKFCFATTEPHKVLPTILSRCQRFDLERIPISLIVQKCKEIAELESVVCEDNALFTLAEIAEGSLRDAELLLDQLICYSAGLSITQSLVYKALKRPARELFFEIDVAITKADSSLAFVMAEKVFISGQDPLLFIERLLDHFRTHLAFLLGARAYLPYLTESEKERYNAHHLFYTETECLSLLDELMLSMRESHKFSAQRTFLETILLKLIHSKKKITLASLVKRLAELESPLPLKERDPILNIPPPLLLEKNIETPPVKTPEFQPLCHTETLLRFASIELEGTIKKE